MSGRVGEFNSAISTGEMVKLISIVRLLSVVGTLCATFQPVSAYLDVTLDRFEQIGDTSNSDWTALKVKRVKKDRKLFGNITYHVNIPNSVLLEIKMFKKQGGEYRLQPYRIPSQGFCDLLQRDTYFYEELTQFSDLPYPVHCPYPKGTYEFRGYSPSLKNLPMAIIPTGDYMIELRAYEGDEIYLNLQIFGSIINI